MFTGSAPTDSSAKLTLPRLYEHTERFEKVYQEWMRAYEIQIGIPRIWPIEMIREPLTNSSLTVEDECWIRKGYPFSSEFNLHWRYSPPMPITI